MNNLSLLSSLAVLAVLLTLWIDGAQAAEGLKVGDPAPAFTMQGTDGKTYKLSDFKGKKPVVLAWFPKAFTPGCTAECKSMRSDGDQLRKYDVAYFTASTDDVETNKKFAESLSLDYPILSDPNREAAKAYGVVTGDKKTANRTTFYIDKNGRIAAIDNQVKTGTHGADIAGKLKELGIAQAR